MEENEVIVEPTNTDESTPVAETPVVDDSSAKELAKYKALLSKANSEAADMKRKLREKMSEEEKAKAEAEEQRASMMAELESLKKEKTLSSYTSNLMTSGLDGDSAKTMANALVDGDMESFFATLKTFTENTKKSAVASAMASQSGMTVGNVVPEVTQKQFDSMSYLELLEFKQKNPELYSKFIKGE